MNTNRYGGADGASGVHEAEALLYDNPYDDFDGSMDIDAAGDANDFGNANMGNCEIFPSGYAWLENDSGFWCFLANPFSNPSDAKRYWRNEHKALAELEEEGWQVVSAYPSDPRVGPDSGINGYGLYRVIH